MVPALPPKCDLGFNLTDFRNKKRYMKQIVEYEGELYKQLMDLMLFDGSFKPGDFKYIGKFEPGDKKRKVKCTRDCHGCRYFGYQEWGSSSSEK